MSVYSWHRNSYHSWFHALMSIIEAKYLLTKDTNMFAQLENKRGLSSLIFWAMWLRSTALCRWGLYPALQKPLLDAAKWTRQEILQRSNMPVQVLKSLYDSVMCTSTCQIYNNINNATCTLNIINMYLILLHLTEYIWLNTWHSNS